MAAPRDSFKATDDFIEAVDSFDTAAIREAMNDLADDDNASVISSKPKPVYKGPPASKAEAVAKARDHGYKAPVPYDYARYGVAPETVTSGKRESGDGAQLTEGVGGPSLEMVRPAWHSEAAKYEWEDEYGEIAPRVPALEEELFRSELMNRRGKEMDKISLELHVTGPSDVKPFLHFEDAGLHPVILENVKLCGYETPTPIQAFCMPAILQGVDVIGVAETGSGKTAAYLIPMLSKLAGKWRKLAAPRASPSKYNPLTDARRAEPLIVIIVPARELALQVFDDARRFCYRTGFRPCVVYGGAPIKGQIEDLQRGCDILIGTLGRINHLLEKPAVLTLQRRKYTVVDEADEMLADPDWEEKLNRVLLPADATDDETHHYMMFSATFPMPLRKLAHSYMSKRYFAIRLGRVGAAVKNVRQDIVWVEEEMKRDALWDLLHSVPPARTLIFVNKKETADRIDDFLYNLGLPSTSMHADRTQREREDAIRAFKIGTAPLLVTTSVTARGLDIRNVMHVINYDMPRPEQSIPGDTGINAYIHRIGRTGRIGNTGIATSFYNERDSAIAEDLVKVLIESGQVIPNFLEHVKPAEDSKLDFGEDKWDNLSSDGEDAARAESDAGDTAASAIQVEAPSEGIRLGDFAADSTGPAGFVADAASADGFAADNLSW